MKCYPNYPIILNFLALTGWASARVEEVGP